MKNMLKDIELNIRDMDKLLLELSGKYILSENGDLRKDLSRLLVCNANLSMVLKEAVESITDNQFYCEDGLYYKQFDTKYRIGPYCSNCLEEEHNICEMDRNSNGDWFCEHCETTYDIESGDHLAFCRD